MGLKSNVVQGWRSTVGGILILLLCVLYYIRYEVHLYYCVTGGFLGIGLIVNPDQIVPIFVTALKTLADAVIGRIAGLIGRKK